MESMLRGWDFPLANELGIDTSRCESVGAENMAKLSSESCRSSWGGILMLIHWVLGLDAGRYKSEIPDSAGILR